ncbi:MAG: tetratricopeptide repeat protein [Chitinophagaceae bacterium]
MLEKTAKQKFSNYFCKMKLKHFLYALIIYSLIACNSNSSKNNIGKKDSLNNLNNNSNAYSETIINLMQQVNKYPDSTGLRLQLATILDSISDYKNAILQMDTLIKKDSTNYGLYFAKAQILQDAKDTLQAERTLIKAIKIYPSPDALLSLANLYAEQKNPESLLICSRVKDLGQGKDYDAHCAFIAGVYNARTGNKNQALKLFDTCIANNYTYMEAYIEKGLIYFNSKQYRQALQVFQFASTVNNLYADAYYYMARCYEMLNVKDSADLRFRQSLSLDKTLVEAQEGLKRLQSE